MIPFIRRIWVFLCILLAGLLYSSSGSVYADTVVIDSIQITPTPEGSTIEINFTQSLAFVTYTLSDPDRLVVDPAETEVICALADSTRVKGELIRGFKLVRPAGSASSDRLDYISFELSQPAEHLVESFDGKLIVRVRPKFQAPSDLVVSSPPQASLVPDEGSHQISRAWNLEKALQFGLSRHRPVRIARAEVELAQSKVREARRALYPAATLKASWTEGTASNVDFREYNTGVQMEQPLYESGRLIETYRQSLVNLQVAEKRQGKVKADFALELAQAYFQWVGAKLSLSRQQGLVAKTSDFLGRTKARFEKNLLTRLELLNVEAQANQAQFQRATAENDVTLSRIKFLQRLSLEPSAQVEIPDDFPEPALRPIDLEEALQLALRYRADIQVNSLLVQFHEYEERIAKAKGKLKVDLSGFIGASAAAFETEPLDSGEDYFIGVKATQSWGPHGATASLTDTHTSPRLGQTTRTDSLVYSGELGILNQLSGLTEVKQAQVNLEKAQRDLEEVKLAVFQEVQEAYLSYEKARLQYEYAQQKIRFRAEQVKILEAQASLNEALPSQVIEAVIKLTDEEVGKAQALSNYYVALAKLNKAVGLYGHYQ